MQALMPVGEWPMISTLVIFGALIVVLAISIIGWAFCLVLGLRWAKVANVTTNRIWLATAVASGVQIALNVVFVFVMLSIPPALAIVIDIAGLAATLTAPCAVIAWIFRVRFRQAFVAWLPTLLVPIGMAFVSPTIIRPFIFEAFANEANNMAPTLLGKHRRGVCSICGQPNYGTSRDLQYALEPPWMICPSSHVTQEPKPDEHVFAGDRFLVAKFFAPRRWDVVTFRHPENNESLNASRLIGLPGETIRIEDGAIWVNDKKITPPDTLQGIQYIDKFPESYQVLWGSKDRPAVLGDNEYFVLGDFSMSSFDSRLWQGGTPDRNPYAVPKSHLRGVVTHIYWPPHRWRVLRQAAEEHKNTSKRQCWHSSSISVSAVSVKMSTT